MESLRLIIKNRDYYVFGLIFLAFFPIFNYGVISVSIILFLLLCVLTWYTRRCPTLFTKEKVFFFIKLSGFYLLLVISMLYSANYKHGFETLFRQVSLLLFPFAFFFIKDFMGSFKRNYRELIFFCFNFSVFIIITLIFILGLIRSPNELFNPGFLRRSMMDFDSLDLHPSYVSFYAVMSILILFESIKSWKIGVWIILKTILCLYFIMAIFLMSSKAIIMAIIIAMFLYLLFFVKRSFFVKMSISISMLILSFIMITSVPTLKARFETVRREYRPPNFENPSTTPVRVGIYSCSLSMLKQNFLFGYGVGDVQDELNRCFEQYTTNIYKKKDYNTHNYLLYLLLSSGVLGLLFFLNVMGYHVHQSLVKRDKTYFIFIIVFLGFLFTENVLVRLYGIILFCLFSTIFILSNFKDINDQNLNNNTNI